MSIQQLLDSGYEVEEIAEELGLTKFQVRAEMNRIEAPVHSAATMIPLIFTAKKKPRKVITPPKARAPRAAKPAAKRVRRAEPRQLAPCGTAAALSRHYKRGEKPCEECAAGRRKGPRELAPCGTRSAYVRHRRNNEEPCDQCRAANAADKADRKKRAA